MCGTGTHLPVYNWLTNTPLHVHCRCASCGQDKHAFSSLQIPPWGLSAENTEVDKCYWKKKRTKYRWGPQLTVVLCVVFLSPSSFWAVWAARGCLKPSSYMPGLGQHDCLGGLPSKECWIKSIPIPQFPDTQLFAFPQSMPHHCRHALWGCGVFFWLFCWFVLFSGVFFWSGKQVISMF